MCATQGKHRSPILDPLDSETLEVTTEMELVLGAVAFIILFAVWVLLPSRIRKQDRES